MIFVCDFTEFLHICLPPPPPPPPHPPPPMESMQVWGQLIQNSGSKRFEQLEHSLVFIFIFFPLGGSVAKYSWPLMLMALAVCFNTMY